MFKFIFPALLGSYSVGTTTHNWVDNNREEAYSNKPGIKRELQVQIWYPSDNESKTYPYSKASVSQLKKNYSGLNKPLNQLDDIGTHAALNVNISEKKDGYPVVIFSHGLCNMVSQYTAMLEELASQGYIVVGINHTYYAAETQLSDGSVVGVAKEHVTQESLFKEEDIIRHQKILVEDVQFVIDKLFELFDKKEKLFEKMDLVKIGFFGHSSGGSTVAQICRLDSRVKAGVDVDGLLMGTNATDNFEKPFMFIFGEGMINYFKNNSDEDISKEHNLPAYHIKDLKNKYLTLPEILFNTLSEPKYFEVIKGAGHNAFGDYSILQKMPFIEENKETFNVNSMIGDVDGHEVVRETNRLVTSFFNNHLK